MRLYDRIADPTCLVRRMYVVAAHTLREESVKEEKEQGEQLDLFTDYEAVAKEKKAEDAALEKEGQLQQALLAMRAACLYSRSTCAQVLRAGAAEASCLLPIARAVELNGADAARLFSAQKRSRLLRPEEHAVLLSALRCISAGTREEMAEALSRMCQMRGRSSWSAWASPRMSCASWPRTCSC